jgi:hypothetical protein
MISRLQQLAGASKAEPQIESDGTYKVVFSPVADFGSFIRGIDFGDVSNRSDAFRTFTLTIDPQRFQGNVNADGGAPAAGVPGAPPGFRTGGVPIPIPTTADEHKSDFFARNGGPDKCVILVFTDAPRPGTPEGMALVAAAKQVAGAQKAADLRISGQRLILLAPVEDVAALAGKINFGTVTGHDAAKREIYVKIVSRQPPAPSPRPRPATIPA